MFHDLQKTIHYLNTLECSLELEDKIHELVKIFYDSRKTLFNKKRQYGSRKIHPVFILEGLDGCGKTTLSYKIAKENKCIRWSSPSKTVNYLKKFFAGDAQLKLAYYIMCNYITSNEISYMRMVKPVIVDRFYHSTAVSYYINQLEISTIEWPVDLLKPTKVFFLDIDEELRLKKFTSRSKTPTEEEIKLNTDEKFRNTFKQLFHKVRHDNFNIVKTEQEIVYLIKN